MPRRLRPFSFSYQYLNNSYKAQKGIVHHPGWKRGHIPTNKTSIQEEELSVQHANHVNSISSYSRQTTNQWKKVRAIDSSITLHLAHPSKLTSPTTKEHLPMQKTCRLVSQVSHNSLLVRHFNPGVQGHTELNIPVQENTSIRLS